MQGAIEEYRKIQDELLEKELLERKRKELDGVSAKRNVQVTIQLINLQVVNASRCCTYISLIPEIQPLINNIIHVVPSGTFPINLPT